MMKHAKTSKLAKAAAAVAVAMGVLGGCSEAPGRDTESPFLSRAEMVVARSLSPVPALPPSPTNRVADDPRAAALGQLFFFDPQFSGPLVDPANIDVAKGGNGGIGEVDNTIDGQTARVACVRCHDPGFGWVDARTGPPELSLGTDFGIRKSMTILNAAYLPFNYWDGRKDSLWSQALGPTESAVEMNFSRVGVTMVIRQKYAAQYAAIFGPLPDLSFLNAFPNFGAGANPQFIGQGRPRDGNEANGFASYEGLTPDRKLIVDTIFANYGKVIEAYERLIVSRDAPFDRFIAGDENAISDKAQRGLKLFIGKGFCINCHNTPRFSDGEFHNLGLTQGGENSLAIDLGREAGIRRLLTDPFNGAGVFSDDRAAGAQKLAGVTAEVNTSGAFRTAPLRGISRAPSFFHTGHKRSLWDVLDFYNRGGDNTGFVGVEDVRLGPPLGLTETEIDEIIEFLKSLDGVPLAPSVLSAPSLPP